MSRKCKVLEREFIIVVILVSGMITLIGIGIGQYIEGKILQDYQQESLEASSYMAKSVDEHLTSKIKELEFLANVIAKKTGDSLTFDFDILNQGLESDIFDTLYLAKPDGSIKSTDGLESNYEKRNFFQVAMNGKSNISDLMISGFDGESEIVYAVPVKRDNQVIGVLCGRDTAEELNKFILSKIHTVGTDVYVVGANGQVILSNNLDNNFVVNLFNDYYLNFSSLNNLTHILSTNQSQSLEWKDSDGKISYINYQKVGDISDWHTLTQSNSEILATNIQDIKSIAYLILFLMNGAFVLTYYCVNKIKKKNLEDTERLAFNDSLTGLLNSNGFMKAIESVFKHSNRTDYSLVVFDLESFKLINEIYGYSKGDQILKAIAHHLKAEFDLSTIIGRLLNDNFVLMLDTRIQHEEKTIPSRIQRVVNLASEQVIGIPLNVSIGIYQFKQNELNIQRAIDNADIARSQAKLNKSQGYYLFDDKLFKNKMDLKLIEQELKSAIKEEHFKVFYQPKVDPCTEEVVGAEALVRWFHPERGFISPALFIPIAEQSEDIVDLGRWIFKEVCVMLAEQKEKGLKSIPISINVSRVELYQIDLILFLQTIISHYQIDPKLIEIEITETTALNDIELILNYS